jgi:YebC/PmpR family DNA-binding regulatory protein
MAGHSKWANIKHKKAATDARRSKIWTRLIKEITVAAKMGGAEVSSNPRLRLAIDKATDANMPKDNIQRAIARGVGSEGMANYEDIRYEAYGLGGAGIIIDCLTDNRIRTVAEVRHALTKNGGNLGAAGSVAFLFTHCGQIVFEPGAQEHVLIDIALEAGAEDILHHDDGSIEILCTPASFASVKSAMTAKNLQPALAEITMKPNSEIVLTGEDGRKMQNLLDAIEALDDVQAVYTNAVIEI